MWLGFNAFSHNGKLQTMKVKTLYVNDEVISLDAKQRLKVHADKVAPLARLGGGEYSGITAPFAMARPK